MSWLRVLGSFVAALVLIALVAAIYIYIASERVVNHVYDAPKEAVTVPTGSSAIDEGKRLVAIRGCAGCHGSDLSGAKFMNSFMEGRATAPSLTATVRDYPVADFVRVVRYGVRPDGKSVQIMPSPMYYHLSDADLGKIIAYLGSLPRDDGLSYQFEPGPMLRWLMFRGVWFPWAQETAEMGPRMPPTSEAQPLLHGEYLARTACVECHGTDLDGDVFSGAPSLVVATAYSFKEFERLLIEGVGRGERDLGLMAVVAKSRFAHFTSAERRMIYDYFQSRWPTT